MMKVVLKLEWSEDKIKQKAMKTVSGLTGVDSISMDTKDKKLTVIGDIDPVKVVAKLRKLCYTEIVSVGPAKEPEKKKEEPKKPDEKKDGDKKDDEKKKDDQNQVMKAYYQAYCQQYPHYQYAQPVPSYAYHLGHRTMEENPNACVIC